MSELDVTVAADEAYIAGIEEYEDERAGELNAVRVQSGPTVDGECLVLSFGVLDEEGCIREAGVWLTRRQAEMLAGVLMHAGAKLPNHYTEVSIV